MCGIIGYIRNRDANEIVLEEVKKVKENEKSKEYYLTDAIINFNKKFPFKIYKLKGKWYDVGNEENLINARIYIKKNRKENDFIL